MDVRVDMLVRLIKELDERSSALLFQLYEQFPGVDEPIDKDLLRSMNEEFGNIIELYTQHIDPLSDQVMKDHPTSYSSYAPEYCMVMIDCLEKKTQAIDYIITKFMAAIMYRELGPISRSLYPKLYEQSDIFAKRTIRKLDII